MLPKRWRGFRGVVNFCLSLLSAYWGLSAYFLAVLGNKHTCFVYGMGVGRIHGLNGLGIHDLLGVYL